MADDHGNVYVNTIGFDFPGGEFAPGLVVLVTPDGNVSQVADGLAFPNGMAVTPDGGTLIVAESYGNRLTAYDIGSDGSLHGRRVWADTPGDHPDGICLDAEGTVWYADVGNLLRGHRPPPGWPLDRPPLPLETSMPGAFAAGDVRHGSIKRVASAVGEGATAIQIAGQYLDETPATSVLRR